MPPERKPADKIELKLKSGDVVNVGSLRLRCSTVHGRHTTIIVEQRPLSVTRTIDKDCTTD